MVSGGTSPIQGPLECKLIGVLKSAAGWKTVRYAGKGNSRRHKKFCQIIGGRFPFNIGAEGEDHFGGPVFFNPAEKRLNAELLGAYVIERSESTTQGVVKPAKNAAAFQRENVGCLLNHAEFLALSRGLQANPA